ncbi:MAG: hypothetical protein JWM98_789 [Thermoleophilia bacterium]|nr:hypothetical protein [Thermoleophilia bacterium]
MVCNAYVIVTKTCTTCHEGAGLRIPPGRRTGMVAPRTPLLASDAGLDALVSRLATAQEGVITRAQLRSFGLSDAAITARVRAGRLHRIHPGVYAVGHAAPSRRGRQVAALLSCGEPSAIARRTALEVWGAWRATERPIDVVVNRRTRPRDGLLIHHTRVLEPIDVAHRSGVRVTTVARTLVDLALELDALQLANVIHELEHRRLFREEEFVACIERMQASVGTPVALTALEMRHIGSAGTRSELERRVRALLVELGLELPEANVRVRTPIGWLEVDNAWRSASVYLEVDGPPHARQRSRNSDRDRRIGLRAVGWREVRVGYLELDLDRAGVARRLLATLPRAAAGA